MLNFMETKRKDHLKVVLVTKMIFEDQVQPIASLDRTITDLSRISFLPEVSSQVDKIDKVTITPLAGLDTEVKLMSEGLGALDIKGMKMPSL